MNLRSHTLNNFIGDTNRIDQNNYFKKLHSMSPSEFVVTQKYFGSAVVHWSAVLGYMISKVPTDKHRYVLVMNLADENMACEGSDSHEATFQKFLKSFEPYVYHTTFPESSYRRSFDITNEFIQKLTVMALDPNWIYSISALAMIEHTYIMVSRMIHNYVKKVLSPHQEIHHYSLHEVMDVTHAKDLFDLVRHYYDGNTIEKTEVMRGVFDGYNALYKFYHEMSLIFVPTYPDLSEMG
jgi:hypothetical protein